MKYRESLVWSRGWACLVAGCLLLFGAAVQADVTLNPVGSGDYPTIQQAIDAVAAYETIWLMDGTYTGAGNRNLDFGGKDVTIRSVGDDPAACVLDCQGSGRGFHFHTNESTSSLLRGITIVGGDAGSGSGGGILCDHANFTMTNCVLNGNAAVEGGGIFFDQYGGAFIDGCRIEANSATTGGGMFCAYDSWGTVTDTTFAGNVAGDLGGGVYFNSRNFTLQGCTLTDNLSMWDGGGIYFSLLESDLIDCVIARNDALNRGGGIYCDMADPEITGCQLLDNWAQDSGGGVYAHISALDLTNCILAANVAGDGGGLYLNQSGSTLLTACTLAHNIATLSGGGMYCDLSSPALINTILWDNLAGVGKEIHAVGTGPTADFCDIDEAGCPSGVTCTSCLFQVDPRFVGGSPTDYHLTLESALIDQGTGDTGTYPSLPSDDIDGDARPDCLGMDIGADEYVFNLADVTIHPDGSGDYQTIQAGIDAACAGITIWLVDGTYIGAGNRNLDFGWKDISVRSLSDDPALCILDCQGNGRGFHVHGGQGPGSVIRGISILNGAPSSGFGGGILCESGSSPTIENCRIADGGADAGGAMHCASGSDPSILDCVMEDNDVAFAGGGISCENASPSLTRCTITGNRVLSMGAGGGAYFTASSSVLEDCTVSGNEAPAGGGVACAASSSVEIVGCRILNNSALDSMDGHGGGIYSSTLSTTIRRCIIDGNTAVGWGGGICTFYAGATITNCIVTGNAAASGGGLMNNGSDLTVTSCTFADNDAGWGGGIASFGTDLPVINSILWSNTATSGGDEVVVFDHTLAADYCDIGESACPTGVVCTVCLFDEDPGFMGGIPFDYHLAGGSGLIDQGTGDAGTYPTLPDEDIDEELRPNGGGHDIGADERYAYTPTPIPGPVPATGPAGLCLLLLALTAMFLRRGSARTR